MYKHLYCHSIAFKKVDGTDENGMPDIIETKDNVPCKIEFKNKLIVSANGVQITSEGNLITDEAINLSDIVTIAERDYTVLSAAPLYDFDGCIAAYKIYF